MKAKEMREKAPEELRHLLAGWREELFKLTVQAKTGQMEQHGRARGLRKEIARALTVLTANTAAQPAGVKETKE